MFYGFFSQVDASLLVISLLGIVVGVVTNRVRILGSNFFNFAFALLVTVYQTLASNIGIPLIPQGVFVFAVAYLFGTFGEKVFGFLSIKKLVVSKLGVVLGVIVLSYILGFLGVISLNLFPFIAIIVIVLYFGQVFIGGGL